MNAVDRDISSDEIISFRMSKNDYTTIIADIQKLNAKLETDKIDLEVRVKQLEEERNSLTTEKKNLSKKYLFADKERLKYVAEREIYDRQHLEVLNSKENEISLLNEQFIQLSEDFAMIENEHNELLNVKLEHDQLKITHRETTNAYEVLYQKANELYNTNQVLNNELNSTNRQNQELIQSLDELNIKLEHLENENSELNRNNIASRLKLDDLKEQLDAKVNEIKEINLYKRELADFNQLNHTIKRLNGENNDKNELIEQLNQAKDFLETTNSQLLVKNIKMQLYFENMNVDFEHGNP